MNLDCADVERRLRRIAKSVRLAQRYLDIGDSTSLDDELRAIEGQIAAIRKQNAR